MEDQQQTTEATTTRRFLDPSQPLALPEGSIRALLAIIVIGADIFMQCVYRWAPPTLDTMAALAFGNYFGAAASRSPAPAGTTKGAAVAVVIASLGVAVVAVVAAQGAP